MPKANAKSSAADFAVGRGKPPSHYRFKPGQSGNPGGRKRGSRNLRTVLEEVLLSEIEMTENGRKRTVSILEALIKRSAQEGLRGDLRAIKDLLDRFERHVGSEPEIPDELAEHDKAILQRVSTLFAGSRVPAAGPKVSLMQDEYGPVEEADDD
jgi:hypothetical protein